MSARAVNFDAIVGPTHNYGGLARGNVASLKSRSSVSRPREAALEGLGKMRLLMGFGVAQGVFPPPLRPDLGLLRAAGFSGSDAAVLRAAGREDPGLLAAASSASAMWAANAATVSPSADCADGRVHVTPANLVSQLHRSNEAWGTGKVLREIFRGESFVHHTPLPCTAAFADEGAANQMRLGAGDGGAGVEVFVYGRGEVGPRHECRGLAGAEVIGAPTPKVYPARQAARASVAVARRHQLAPGRVVFVRQCPEAIDAGVFHNDVAAVANENVLFCHARAYVDQGRAIEDIRGAFAAACPSARLHVIEVSEAELTLAEAVETYLFNSQIVTLGDGTMALIAPGECEHHARARAVIGRLLSAGTPVRAAHFVPVRQSMRNGGGPACLRLRVVLSEAEVGAVLPGVMLDEGLYGRLVEWVARHYREELSAGDLMDVGLLEEGRAALGELYGILGMGMDLG